METNIGTPMIHGPDIATSARGGRDYFKIAFGEEAEASQKDLR